MGQILVEAGVMPLQDARRLWIGRARAKEKGRLHDHKVGMQHERQLRMCLLNANRKCPWYQSTGPELPCELGVSMHVTFPHFLTTPGSISLGRKKGRLTVFNCVYIHSFDHATAPRYRLLLDWHAPRCKGDA